MSKPAAGKKAAKAPAKGARPAKGKVAAPAKRPAAAAKSLAPKSLGHKSLGHKKLALKASRPAQAMSRPSAAKVSKPAAAAHARPVPSHPALKESIKPAHPALKVHTMGAAPQRPQSTQVRPAPGERPPLVQTVPPRKPLAAPARPVPKPQAQVARSFYWSELRTGDDLPHLSKSAIDRVQIARYAGASNEFNRLQLDEPYAQSLGFHGTFAPGTLAMGFVGQLLTNWLQRGHVRKLAARFVKLVKPGDELVCRGRISELRRESGACYADLEVWAENQKGELVLRGQATCELYETPGSAPGLGAALLSTADRPRPPGASAGKPPPRRK